MYIIHAKKRLNRFKKVSLPVIIIIPRTGGSVEIATCVYGIERDARKVSRDEFLASRQDYPRILSLRIVSSYIIMKRFDVHASKSAESRDRDRDTQRERERERERETWLYSSRDLD